MRVLAVTLVAGLAATLATGLAATASARTWTVQPPGVPSIQSTVDMAADGDTIVLEDGLYYGAGATPVDLMGKALVLQRRRGLRQRPVFRVHVPQQLIQCGGRRHRDPVRADRRLHIRKQHLLYGGRRRDILWKPVVRIAARPRAQRRGDGNPMLD